MSKLIDAVIIGAGPVGSYSALSLAKKGIRATVFEEHPTIGVPSHCAGHISIKSLRKMGLYPLPENIIENEFSTANFYSPYGTKFSIKLSCPVTVALNRARFDQYLAKKALEAGADYELGTRVESLLKTDNNVTGLKVRNLDDEVQVKSKIVLDTEGISSRLLRQSGLVPLNPNGLVYGVEAEMENIQNIDQDAVEVYFGKAYAPGFYAWLIPRPDGSAKVGLATNQGDPRQYMRRLMLKHPVASTQLRKARISSLGYHAISLAGPISKTYTNGFLAIGDCASQVKPTTGGGVIFGLTCSNIAAEVASYALKLGDTSESILHEYQKRCDDLLSFDFKVMLKLRRFLNCLSDEKIDDILQVCSKLGVDKALVNVDEIDHQGKLILTTARKPAMLAMLVYFGLLYLSANP